MSTLEKCQRVSTHWLLCKGDAFLHSGVRINKSTPAFALCCFLCSPPTHFSSNRKTQWTLVASQVSRSSTKQGHAHAPMWRTPALTQKMVFISLYLCIPACRYFTDSMQCSAPSPQAVESWLTDSQCVDQNNEEEAQYWPTPTPEGTCLDEGLPPAPPSVPAHRKLHAKKTAPLQHDDASALFSSRSKHKPTPP